MDGRIDLLQEGRRPRTPCRGQPADEARNVPAGARWVARVHALRSEGQVEITTRDESGFLEDSPEWPACGSRKRGGLKDDQLAAAQAPAYQPGGPQHRIQVRNLRPVDRGGHTDEQGVRARKVRSIWLGDSEP